MKSPEEIEKKTMAKSSKANTYLHSMYDLHFSKIEHVLFTAEEQLRETAIEAFRQVSNNLVDCEKFLTIYDQLVKEGYYDKTKKQPFD